MKLELRQHWAAMPAWTGALIALCALVLFTAIFTPAFLTAENLFNILRQWSFVGIIAVGMTFVIILGGIDLSVGSLVAFAGGLGLVVMNTIIGAPALLTAASRQLAEGGASAAPGGQWRYALALTAERLGVGGNEAAAVAAAFLVILLTGLLAGWLNGVLVTRGRLAPFIATLGGLAAFRSLALAMADGGEFRSSSVGLFQALGTGGIRIPGTNVAPRAPLPIPLEVPWPVIIFLLIAVAGHLLLQRTRFGRYVVAIGCNERAAVYSAIRVQRVKLLTYVLSGVCTGVSALLVASRMNSVSSSQTGSLYELDVIAAVVIGGTRMSGGAGTITGTVIGVLILGVIGNMLGLLQVSPYLQGLVKGVIIIAAVLVQRQGGRER
jgi:ribose transport system permease protein